MNILFLTYQGDIAGSTNSISYLAKGLAAKGHNVFVGCRKECLLFQLLGASDITLIPMTFKSKFDLANIHQIYEAVINNHIDIINAQSSKDRYTAIFAKIKYGFRAKVVHTRRQISKSSGGVFQSAFYMAGTSKIIAVSNGVKKSLTTKGIRASHIEVIYNGTPKEKYNHLDSTLQSDLIQKFNISDDTFVIGCVSRKKNQHQLLHALAKLDFNFRAIFVGLELDDEYRSVIESYGAEFKEKIHFEGLVEGGRILNYYKLFDIKVLPSTMEGLSQSLLEAMYLKVPVIATRAAGNIDLIQHGINGFLFEDGDIEELKNLILDVYHRNPETETVVNQAYITASQDFSIEKTINRHEDLFNKLSEADYSSRAIQMTN